MVLAILLIAIFLGIIFTEKRVPVEVVPIEDPLVFPPDRGSSTVPAQTATTSTSTQPLGPLGTTEINNGRILKEWETYDDQSYTIQNEEYSATYYAPDGSIYASLYAPFSESRVAFEAYLVEVTGQSLTELCSTDLHVFIEQGNLYGTRYGEVGLSACPQKPI
jgi:hypothetical protein